MSVAILVIGNIINAESQSADIGIGGISHGIIHFHGQVDIIAAGSQERNLRVEYVAVVEKGLNLLAALEHFIVAPAGNGVEIVVAGD